MENGGFCGVDRIAKIIGTLLMLVSCFCAREKVLAAYELAKRERMRFYSYGDCMLLY